MSLLSVEDIRFSYDDGGKVLEHISFTADGSGIVCVAGASGAGKTTLLKVISGLLAEDGGTVCINGEDQKEIVSNKRKISCVFQNSFLYPHMTVYENVMMGVKAKMTLEEKDALVKELLRRFRLTKFINLKPKQLSEGQRQRAAVAKCMASRDDVYLLDEPMSHLDEPGKERMALLLRQLQREKQAPFLCVCHDPEQMLRLADRILILHQGRVLQYDTPQALLRRPQSMAVLEYLGVGVNVIPGRLRSGTLTAQDGTVLDTGIDLPDQEVKIVSERGNFRFANGTTAVFRGTVEKSTVGREGRWYTEVRCGDAVITVPAGESGCPEEGKTEEIAFRRVYYLFDSAGEKRMYNADKENI